MNHWTEQNNALHKTFEFSTFQEAIDWMVKAYFKLLRCQN